MVNYFWNNQLICVALARSAVSDDTFALLGEDVPHDGSHPWELQGLSALWVLHTKGERSSWPAWRSKLWPHLKRLLSSIRCESITGASEKHRGHIWDAITQNTVRAGYDHRSCVLGHNDGLPAQPEQQAKCFHLHISIWFTGMQISCFGSLNWQSWAAKVCLVQLISLFNWYQKYHKLFWVVESGEIKKKKYWDLVVLQTLQDPMDKLAKKKGKKRIKTEKEGGRKAETTDDQWVISAWSFLMQADKTLHASSSNWQHIYKSGLNTDAVFLHTCHLMYAENVNNRSAVCHIYRLISHQHENTSDKTREGKRLYYYSFYTIIPTKLWWLFSCF